MRHNSDSGAMLLDATLDRIAFQFITRRGELIDSYAIDSSGRASSALQAQPPTQIKPPPPNPFLRPNQARVE